MFVASGSPLFICVPADANGQDFPPNSPVRAFPFKKAGFD